MTVARADAADGRRGRPPSEPDHPPRTARPAPHPQGGRRPRSAWPLACALLVLVRWPTGGVSDLSGARSLQVLARVRLRAARRRPVPGPGVPGHVARPREGQGDAGPAAQLADVAARGSTSASSAASSASRAVLLLHDAAGGGRVLRPGRHVGARRRRAAVRRARRWRPCSSRRSACSSAAGPSRPTARCARPTRLVLAVAALPLAPHWLLQGDTGPLADAADWLRCLSPIPAVMEVLGQGGVGTHGMGAAGGAVGRYAGRSPRASSLAARRWRRSSG